ncbi:type II secretion system F family protein [Pseudomonas gingeri]|uniref:type II secretion system F family protein n=1 Tax=Pseudomonas gingeri TaxID=117681 RepID=UPI00210B0B38
MPVTLAELFQHASVESLATLLEQRSPLPERVEPWVVVRSTGSQPPLFLVHEFSGADLYFPALGQHLEGDFPIYGLPGVAPGQPRLDTLECLASRLLEVIRTVQPEGPYRLAGWSFGGVLAYEIAQQLLGQDQVVAFLGLIDTYVPRLTDQGKARWSDEHAHKRHLLLQCTALATVGGNRQVLEQLAHYTEARQQSRQKIQLALVYPLILLLASMGIVGFLLGYVVPDVVRIFIDGGRELPLLTRGLIGLSDGLRAYAVPILVGVFGLGLLLRLALSRQRVRLRWHAWLLRAPLAGGVFRAVEAARFASTLAILCKSAVPLVDALEISATVIGNLAIRARMLEVARSVREGGTLTRGLEQSGDIPPLMLHMIASGERAGELDSMLARAAEQQEKTLAARIALVVSLFEPAMLVVMGGVVLLIVMAILLPILSLNQMVN